MHPFRQYQRHKEEAQQNEKPATMKALTLRVRQNAKHGFAGLPMASWKLAAKR
jgi:hypothetical protein